MKKFGKFCWWIMVKYLKLNLLVMAFVGYGDFLYRSAKKNVHHIETIGEAYDVMCDQFIKQFKRALFGFI